MKNINFKKILLLAVFACLVKAKINGQDGEYKILFIQPSARESKEFRNWMTDEEGKLDNSKCFINYDDLILKDLNQPYRKKIKNELDQYTFWIYKTVANNNGLITIKYELEDRRANPKIKKVLGVFKGFEQNEFSEWFSKSINKYCNKLLKSGALNLTPVFIGQMAANQEDINNTPNLLNMNLLNYKFKEASRGIFTDRYVVQIDDKVSSSGLICVNMAKMDSIKDKQGSYYKRLYLKVVVKNVPDAQKPVINLDDTFDASLKTASITIAEIIAKYNNR